MTPGKLFRNAVCLGHMSREVAIVLTCDPFSNAANIADAGFFFLVAGLIRVHDLFSNIIKSGVTICGTR